MSSPFASRGGEGNSIVPKPPRNRNVRCKGRTVIRYAHDTQEGDIIHRKGDPILNEDYARQYKPCEAFGANGTEYCSVHGGSAPQVINVARREFALATQNARAVLQQIAEDERVPPGDRIKAAVQLLDRGGVRAGVDLAIETPGWQRVLGKMFGSPDDDDESTQDESQAAEPVAPTPAPRETKRAKAAPPAERETATPVAKPRKATKATPRKAAPPPTPKVDW